MSDPSLHELAIFAPNNRAVKEYIETTKSKWSNGNYWLGGHINLSPTDKITDELCKKVREIYDIDSYYCNSYEMATINHGKALFAEIQVVAKQFREMKSQDELNKIIVSMCK
jgi:hypothetical protein